MTDKRLAIITDSSCDLPVEYIEEHGIFVLPLHINMPNGKTFLDGVNINPEEIYSNMPNIVPTTSQPAPEDVMNLFDKVKKAGYKEAIAVMISSGMSGTYQVVKMCVEEEKELIVHAYDSKKLSMALGMVVINAVELNEQGLSAKDIISNLSKSRDKSNGFFCIPTLSYLVKGGRIGKVAGTIGTLLGIVPIISINTEGQYYSAIKTRNYAIAMKKMVDRVKEIVQGKLVDIAILEGAAKDKAKELYEIFKDVTGIRNLMMCHVSPAMGVHSGPGLVGLVYRIIN